MKNWFSKKKEDKEQNINPKFGISYVLFDGEELFEASLRNVRPFVDYINVIYSPKSYYGFDGNPEIPNMLDTFVKNGLLDDIIVFEHKIIDSSEDRYRLEVEKRNLGLQIARKANVNYFMTMDTDEFYDQDAFKKAQQKIIANNITHSFVHILNYGSSPTRRYDKRKWEYYVPFFSKINSQSFLGENDKTPCLTDTTRQVSDCVSAKYYVLEDIFMHHMTRVRTDVNAKYITRKVSSDIDKDWINDEEGFVDVPNYFSIEV